MTQDIKTKVLNSSKVCVKCGSNEDLTVDHIMPKSKGGGDNLGNLQILCAICNFAKSNKLPTLRNRFKDYFQPNYEPIKHFINYKINKFKVTYSQDLEARLNKKLEKIANTFSSSKGKIELLESKIDKMANENKVLLLKIEAQNTQIHELEKHLGIEWFDIFSHESGYQKIKKTK